MNCSGYRKNRLRLHLVVCFPLAAACLALFLGPPWAGAGEPANRPNVLLLLTDDQRPDTIAALGNPVIQTPNLDALARSGLAFNHCYCLGSNSGAACLPSRNMLLSGRAYFRWKGPYASGDDPNFPVTMRRAGYQTYHHGKRGNTAIKIQERFEINKYLRDDEADRRAGEPGRVIVDDAIAFLKSRDASRPFFMYLALANPHDPRVAAPKYLDLYRRDHVPLPRNYLPEHPFDNGELKIRDELLAPWPRSEAEIRRHLHEYYAVISGMDYHIGRLLQALRDLGLARNTLILFASDNGLALGSHGLLGKQNLYEHSAGVPLVVAGPGIRPGRSDALVYLMDLFPTVCDLVGVAAPPGLDGRSFKPVLDGKQTTARDSIFLSYRNVQRAIRDGRWKLIRYPKIGKTQLFDLQTDPDELHDLSANPAQSERIRGLMEDLRHWQKHWGDDLRL